MINLPSTVEKGEGRRKKKGSISTLVGKKREKKRDICSTNWKVNGRGFSCPSGKKGEGKRHTHAGNEAMRGGGGKNLKGGGKRGARGEKGRGPFSFRKGQKREGKRKIPSSFI